MDRLNIFVIPAINSHLSEKIFQTIQEGRHSDRRLSYARRVKRYTEVFFPKFQGKFYFYPASPIAATNEQIETEIRKIVEYAQRGISHFLHNEVACKKSW